MDVRQILEEKAAEKDWSPKAVDLYENFSNILMQKEPLTLYAGAGGVSYYKKTGRGPVFICHINVTPRRRASKMAYLSFRQASLEKALDVDALQTAVRRGTGPDDFLKVGPKWTGLHFPMEDVERVAKLVRREIVEKVTG